MSTLDDVEKAIASLSRSEKAKLLQRIARDLEQPIPGIESRSEVAGGDPCIIRTRIPVWLLEHARRLGTSDFDLLRSYPSLRAEDLAHAWAYVQAHPDEIERQIRDNEAA
jgi:uncharacterized protein (DUF433 family)